MRHLFLPVILILLFLPALAGGHSADSAAKLYISGKLQNCDNKPETYTCIKRAWNNNDVIEWTRRRISSFRWYGNNFINTRS